MMDITNSEELLDCYAQILCGKLNIEEIKLAESFVGGMHFRGAKWQGRVDASVAGLVLDTQRYIRRAYKKASKIDGQNTFGREKEIRIEFEVTNGSTNIISILEKLLPLPVLYMSSEHALYCSIVIALTLLGMKHIDAKTELLKKIEDEKTKQKLIEMNKTMLADIQKSLSPFVSFVKKMSRDDSLEFSETGIVMTRDQAIQHFSINFHPENMIFIIDDLYDVTNVHLKSTKVTLELRGITIIARIDGLSSNDKVALFAAIDSAGVASDWPSLNLQITLCIHGSDRIARVEGFGEKREGHVTLEHALFVSGIANENTRQRHLPLLDFAGE